MTTIQKLANGPVGRLLLLFTLSLSACSVLEGRPARLAMPDPLVVPGYLGPVYSLGYVELEDGIEAVIPDFSISGADWIAREGDTGGVALTANVHTLRISGFGSGTLHWDLSILSTSPPIHTGTFVEPGGFDPTAAAKTAILSRLDPVAPSYDLAVEYKGVTVHFDIRDGP